MRGERAFERNHVNPPVERIDTFHVARGNAPCVTTHERLQTGEWKTKSESRLVSRRVPPAGAARRRRAAVRQEEEGPTDARTPAAASRTAAGIERVRT
jgi:hypothetical protein